MRIHNSQFNFSGGIVDSDFSPSSDSAVYMTGMSSCNNFVLSQLGALMRRPGFRYITTTNSSSLASTLIPFASSASAVYILEFCNSEMRVFKDGVLQATVAQPYSASQLLELRWVQYREVIYLFHKDVATRKITRTDDTTWAITTVTWVDGPYDDANTTSTTLSFGNILNGTFDSNINDWTNNSVGTGAISFNTNRLRLVSGTTTNFAKAYQALSGVPAGTYTLMFDTVTAQSSVSVSTTVGGAEISALTSYAVATDNRVQFTVTSAQAGTIYINFEQRTASTTSDIDNVRILDMGVSAGTSVQVIASAATFTSNDVGRYIRIQATNSIVDKLVYAGNSSKKAFDISDLQLSPDGIDVYTYVTTTGVQTFQIPGTDYTISNNQVVMTTVPSTGTNVLINPKCWGDGKWAYALITAFTSSTRVTATLQNFCSGRNVSTRWRLGSFYTGNFPNVGTFHEGRLYLANNSNVLYGSVSGNFESFKPDNAATRGIPDPAASVQFKLASKENFRILWLLSQKALIAGTSQDLVIIQAGQGGYISARALPIPLRIAETACSSVPPIVVDDEVIFADATNQRLYTIVGSQSGPQVQTITGHASELFRTKTISQLVFQKYPHKLLWIERSDGSLVTATKSLKYGNWGFTTHTLGGVSPVAEGIASVPTSTGTDLYITVSRTIGGGTVRYIEELGAFSKDLSLGTIITQDSAIAYSGVSTGTITGLGHLNGETVHVNNGSHGSTETKVPSGGSISLTNNTTSATIGLFADASFQTLPLIMQLGNGSAIHKVKNVYKGDAEVYQTIGMQVGVTASATLSTVPFDSTTAVFSGHKSIEIGSDFGTDVTIYVKQPNPLPITVKNITISSNIEDER